jgi:hypothetical protein
MVATKATLATNAPKMIIFFIIDTLLERHSRAKNLPARCAEVSRRRSSRKAGAKTVTESVHKLQATLIQLLMSQSVCRARQPGFNAGVSNTRLLSSD